MYMIPDDEFDVGIKHAMLHADYDLSKAKRNLVLPFEDHPKKIRK